MASKKNIRKTAESTYAKRPQEEENRDEIYRELTEQQPVYQITIEEAPVSVRDLIPAYRYRFDGGDTSSGDQFLEYFTEFLEANAYLVMDDNPSREFAAGFARAAAMAALAIDGAGMNPQP